MLIDLFILIVLYLYSREEILNYMQKDLASMVFNMLSNRINEQVTCKVWHFGTEVSYTGILENVTPFDSVVIDKNVIPFVGTGQAIETISLTNGNKVVYTNPQAKGYNVKDVMGVILAQESMLGYSVTRDGLEKSVEEKSPKRR